LTQQSIDALGCAATAIEAAGRGHSKGGLCHKHNQARKLVLNGGYDAMLHIDADMVVPADAVDRLIALDADVAYGLYVSRHTPSRWLCFTDIATATVLSDDKDRARQVWGKTIVSIGAGMGCTLIHRHVLERIEFRTDGMMGADWNFAQDCAAYGFSQAHDLGCVCGHINGDKVLWPDVDAPELYRAEKIS
jgi:hypothetical protein